MTDDQRKAKWEQGRERREEIEAIRTKQATCRHRFSETVWTVGFTNLGRGERGQERQGITVRCAKCDKTAVRNCATGRLVYR
jgi:hypothetical protein